MTRTDLIAKLEASVIVKWQKGRWIVAWDHDPNIDPELWQPLLLPPETTE